MKSSSVTAYLEKQEKERLQTFAEKHNTAMSTIVRIAIYQYIFMVEKLLDVKEIQ
jgi:predicted transcriptional regulator